MPTKEEREAHRKIYGGVQTLDAKVDAIGQQQSAQMMAQTPISMLHGIQPPYFYGDEGEDVEAFIYALVNCASANDWKDSKTVSNLAHFLDGRAGYAFRAAVRHRVERARGSQEETLKKKRENKEKVDKLNREKEEAARELRELGARIGALKAVKEEEGESKEKGEEDTSPELAEAYLQYEAASQLFSTASIQYAAAQTEQAMATSVITTTKATADNIPAVLQDVEGNHHAIAFPTLDSALSWLRNTFRREDVEDKLTGDYFGRKQGASESVQDYALELLKLSSRAGLRTTEEKQTKHFIDGLRIRLKNTLKHFIQVKRISVDVKDWEGVVKAAGQLEREHPGLQIARRPTQRDRERHTFNAISTAAPEPTQGTSAAAVPAEKAHTYQFEDFMAAVSAFTNEAKATAAEGKGREHNNSDRARRCYNCHEIGHLSWQCPRKPSQQTQQWRERRSTLPRYNPTCYRCNKVGHYSNNCPEGAGYAGAGGNKQRGNERGREVRNEKGNAPRTYPGAPQQGERRTGNANRA